MITSQFNMATDGVLKYRAVGETAWRKITAKPTQLKMTSNNPAALDPAEDIISPDATDALVFDLLNVGLKPETEYEYLIEAGRGQITTVPEKFITLGEGKILTVNPNDGPNGVQNALNLALPGDEIHLTPGVFAQSGVLAHSGKPGKPIRIKGAGSQVTILDGGKRYATMLRLDHVRDVIVSDLQMRLFQRSGITAENCTNLVIEGCRFLNKGIAHVGYTKGTGVVLTDSPGVTVSRSVFTRLLYGIQAVNSPGLILENNTAFKNLYSAALVKNSSRDSRILRNSFTFTGNTSLYLIEADPKAFASLSCDYNNYGTLI